MSGAIIYDYRPGRSPFHTIEDGDVLWAVTTGTGPAVHPTALGIVASEVAWDAVLSSASPVAA